MTENKRLFVGRKTVEDRFTIVSIDDEIGVKENRSGDVIVLKHNDLNAQQFVAQLVVFLNDQNQAIVDLFDGSKYWSDKATEKIKELEEQNEQLKGEVKRLKCINKQLEKRLDKDIALNMDCGDVEDLKTRNKRQYERLKELTDLMFKRDWETLETMVDEWEREDEYLRKYGG